MTDQLSFFDDAIQPNKTEVVPEQEIESIPLNKDTHVTALPELVPPRALMALNRRYSIQANHASRILRLAVEQQSEKEPITRDSVANELGIAWARVQGTISVMRKCQLLTSKNVPTSLGTLVQTHAPHMDEPGLLWSLHYLLASNARLVLWSHLFNRVLIGVEEIEVADITPQFRALSGMWSESTLNDKLPDESRGILRTYSDALFAPLGLLSKGDGHRYEVYTHTMTLPPMIWLTTILIYRDRYYPGAPSLEIPLIADANYSPGRILRQREAAVRRALDELHAAGLLTVETRSGLDQVRFKRESTWLSTLAVYFEERSSS